MKTFKGISGSLCRILLLGFSLSVLLSGCSTTTLFTSYPSKIAPYQASLNAKQKIDLGACLRSECQSNDRILYNMERGRISQILDNVEGSKADYNCALDAIKINEEKALVSASNVGGTAASVLLNDNAKPYEGEGYERVMLHHYQAINFLLANDLEGAGVEIRRANAQQEEALKRHEAEIEKARKKAEDDKVDMAKISSVEMNFAKLDEAAGKVKNSFQNAYTFYLSGLVYEAMKQPGDAYIDYKKALQIYPNNKYVLKDVLRLAETLDMEQDLQDYKGKYGLSGDVSFKSLPKGFGEVVVLYDDGFVPIKEEVKFPIPVPTVGLTAVAFPIYNYRWEAPLPLAIVEDNNVIEETETIAHIDALAVKALKERIPGIVVRQVVRSTAKAAASKVAKDKLGALGGLGVDLFNIVSENADLRSWMTLPRNGQILRVALPAGEHNLKIRRRGMESLDAYKVAVRENGLSVLYVICTGTEYYVRTIPLAGGGKQLTDNRGMTQ